VTSIAQSFPRRDSALDPRRRMGADAPPFTAL